MASRLPRSHAGRQAAAEASLAEGLGAALGLLLLGLFLVALVSLAVR